MKKWLVAMMLLLVPMAAQAGKNDTVVVDIGGSRNPKTVTLVRKGGGFVGPRGEYYPSFPSKATLAAIYGNSTPKPSATPKPDGGKSADYKVKVVTGGVIIRRDGKLVSEIRTVRPNVNGWRLVRDKTAIVIKSNRDGEPGIVEMFDVKTGRLENRIKSTDVKDGKPAWAKHFAE